jgi:hypothetical protein
MAWWFGVIEARHELQNPTSPDKILLLGERLGLGPDSHVLDLAAGRGGPALLLAGDSAAGSRASSRPMSSLRPHASASLRPASST